MKRTIWCIAILAATIGLFAQVKETVNVYVVEVPVTVVDSGGNPVRGLTAANFELTDNGTKRAITSFDKIDFASTESVSAISPLNPSARRQFMLLFDLGYSSPNSLARAQEAARKFIKESVQPRDLVAVGTVEPDRGFRMLSAFTTDRALVASTIDDPRGFRGADPLQIANQTESFQAPAEDPGLSSGGGNRAMADEEQRLMAASMKRVNEGAVRQRIEKEVDFLGQLAKMLRAVPGRKQVVLLSEGFDAKYLQGRDVRAGQEAANENEQVLRGQFYNVDNDARFGNTASMTILDRMAQFFRQSDVVLNAIDIQGIRVQNDIQQGSSINSNAGLFLLARPTGGEVFENVNNLKTNFDRMLRQQEVVYVLGFQAPTLKSGTFHNLRVKLVNVPGGRVSHRAGYYEGGGETPAERALSNAEIIVNDIAQADVHLAALSAAFPGNGKNAQVPVILEINGGDVMKDLHANAANVEVFIYAFDQDGIVRDRLYQRIGFDLKKVGDRLRATGIKYYATLSLPPGRYAVKSLVREIETDRRGFGRTDITVPSANEAASLQPVPIDDQVNWVLVKGNSHDANAAYPFVLNGQQFIPSATARGKVALFVYGAKPEDITFETTPKTTILGRSGSAFVLQLNPEDAKAASLDITVHTKGASDAKKVSVPIAQ
ncbi:MAG TPA: VWA domain-containing protein [Thermoanaerobaculia bacterium]|nr:VWA domain-containing protein [Thermoanaerobaculia bacterium]